MKLLFATFILIIYSCHFEAEKYNNQNNLHELIDTYIFLSEKHDLLHIMMGEYEGSPKASYIKYKEQITTFQNNIYFKPILFGLKQIIIKEDNSLDNATEFDALVDYYQMGIQLMIEGILKGYGYKEKIPQNSFEYKKIKLLDFSTN